MFQRLLLAFCLVLPFAHSHSDDAYSDSAAEEAVREYLKQPRIKSLNKLLDNFANEWLRYEGKLVKLSSVNWALKLRGFELEGYKIEHAARTKDITNSKLSPLEKIVALKRRYPNSKQYTKHALNRSLLIKEALPKYSHHSRIPFKPGERVWSMKRVQNSRVHVTPQHVYIFHENTVSLCIQHSQNKPATLKSLLKLDKLSTYQVFAKNDGLWLCHKNVIIRITPRQRIQRFKTPVDHQLWGAPMMGPDYVVAPCLKVGKPSEFSLCQWALNGQLKRQHSVFNRYDSLGQCRGQQWLAGPLTHDGFAYLTHAGYLVLCDIEDAAPRELIKYPSLDLEETLLHIQEEPKRQPQFVPSPHSETAWVFKAQDSRDNFTLDLNGWTLNKTRQAIKIGKVQLDHQRHLYLEGEGLNDRWIPFGKMYLNITSQYLHCVKALSSEQSSYTDLMRMGKRQAQHPHITWQYFTKLLKGKPLTQTQAERVIAEAMKNPEYPPVREWLPLAYKHLPPKLQSSLWSRWQQKKDSGLWPLKHGLHIPPLFLSTVFMKTLDQADYQGNIDSKLSVRDQLKAIIQQPGTAKAKHVLHQLHKNPLGMGRSEQRQLAEIVSAPARGPWRLAPPIKISKSQISNVSDIHFTYKKYRVSWPHWKTVNNVSATALKPSPVLSADILQAAFSDLKKTDIVTGTQGPQGHAVIYKNKRATRLQIKDKQKKVWVTAFLLSPQARVHATRQGFVLVDSLQGIGWVLNDKGNNLFSFPLIEEGDYDVYSKAHHTLLVGNHYTLALSQVNRYQQVKKWWEGKQSSYEKIAFNLLWQQAASIKQIEAMKSHTLYTEIRTAWQHLKERKEPRQLKANYTHEIPKVNGVLDDAYDETYRLTLHGASHSFVYALYTKKGLLIAVSTQDKIFVKMSEGDKEGTYKGDIVSVSWDPLGDGHWWPNADDRQILLGVIDPNAMKIGAPKANGRPPFKGEVFVNHNSRLKTTVYECFIPYESLGKKLPCRLNVIWQNDEGNGKKSWHSLGSNWHSFKHIPRLMPSVVK